VIRLAGAKAVKQLLIERGMTLKELAEKLNIEHQSMRTKLYRDKFSYEEIIKIADILNADVRIITRDSGKQF
jgi:transcriptional regulator with XRE-family HTH domain